MASTISSFCSSSRVFRAQSGLGSRRQLSTRGVSGATMMKRDIHPEWYPEAKVFCNGVEVMSVGGTKQEYNVDVYSGNHPFYQGNASTVVVDEGQLNKFKKRFSELEELSTVANLTTIIADDTKAPKQKDKKKGGKKRR